MVVSGDWALPRLNGLPYLDKPVLHFAAEAATMSVLGPTTTAARLPSLLFTLATIALLGWFARRTLGDREALVAMLALASCPIVIAFSRIVIFDAALSLFVTLSIFAFYFAIEAAREGKPHRKWTALGWASIGFGILTKGPIAILLPLIVAIPYGLIRKRARAVFSIVGVVLMFVVIAPWIWLVSQQLPEFLHYALVTETMKRLATNELKRTGPIWYFLPLLFAGGLPWVVMLATSGFKRSKEEGERHPVALLSILWLVLPLIFFSLSKSKRPQYLVPMMPSLALLVAWHYSRLRERLRGAKAAAVVYVVLAIGMIGYAFSGKIHKAELVAPLQSTAVIWSSALLVCAAIVFLSSKREVAIVALSVPMLMIPLASAQVIDVVANGRSSLQLAQKIEQLHPKKIIAVRAYSPSLAYYLRQPLPLYSRGASELTSNYLIRNFDKYASRPDTSLKPVEAFEPILQQCSAGTFFFTEEKVKEWRSALSQKLPLAAEGNHLFVYGPCGAAAEAR